jgi:hypothetical protein
MYDTGKLSTTTLLLVGLVPVFFTVIVNVRFSFSWACEGLTETVMDAFGVKVPVNVGEGVNVCVGDGPAVPVFVGDGTVPVTVTVGEGVLVSAGTICELLKTTGK